MSGSLLWMIVIIGLAQTAATSTSEFNCVINRRNWYTADNLNISWELKLSQENLDVNVSWHTRTSWGSCTEESASFCVMHYGDLRSVDFDTPFHLTVILSSQDNKSMVYNETWFINPDNCAKPPAVDEISLRTVNSTCIEARWSYSGVSLCSTFFQKLYQLKIAWKGRESMVNISGFCDGSHTFCGLHPARVYTVNVCCRQLDYKNNPIGHWSDGTWGSVNTPEDIPSGAPLLVPGGYSYNQDDCDMGGTRNVFVFWKEVEPSQRNGIITRYVQELRTVGSENTATIHFYLNGREAIRNMLQLECGMAYKLRIRAGTAVGVSNNFSTTLHIPAHETHSTSIQLIPEVLKNRDPTIVSISWKTTFSSSWNITAANVFWCGSDSRGMCATQIDWMPLDDSQTSNLTVRLAPSSTAAQYVFGISLDSRGILWTSCHFIADAEILYPRGLRVDSRGPAQALTIRWDNPPCGSRPPSVFIDFYILKICEVPNQDVQLCPGDVREIAVSGKAQSAIITDVIPSTVYMIQIAAVDRKNNTSIYSNPIYSKSPSADDKNNVGQILKVVILTLVLCLVVASLLCLIRHLRRRLNKYPLIYDFPLDEVKATQTHLFD